MKPCYAHLSIFIAIIKENRKREEETWNSDGKIFKKQNHREYFM